MHGCWKLPAAGSASRASSVCRKPTLRRPGWSRWSDMLRMTIHAGLLAERTDANQLAVLDIAYQKRAPLADYVVALTLRKQGELEPACVANYPRWSGSLWDLTARALTRVL